MEALGYVLPSVNIAGKMGVALAILKPVALLGLLLLLIITVTQFKYILIIRHMNAEGVVMRRELGLARCVKDKKSGAMKLQRYLKRSDIIPMAPSDTIVPCMSSYKLLEMYKMENGEYGYIYPKLEVDEEARKVINNYEFRPAERSAYVEELKDANSRNENWKAMILPIAALGSMVILILGMMLFYGKVADPLIKQGQINAQTTAEINKLLKTYQNIKTGTVELGEEPVEIPTDTVPPVDVREEILGVFS
jgi:hypothetical protein